MQEQLITFETAKLAKEKGFNEMCKTAYGRNADSLYYGNCTHKNSENIFLSAPTQSLLQKWLREVYDIEMYVRSTYKLNKKNKYWVTFIDCKIYGGCLENCSKTYEEALEVGLQESLKLIKIVKNAK